jgi:hypothetical protein
VYCVKGLLMKMPALLIRVSIRPNRANPWEIVRSTAADLHLENIVTFALEHRLRFGDIDCRGAAGERPRHGQPISHSAAQQLGNRKADPFAAM